MNKPYATVNVKKEVGQVSPEERDEIKRLFERKNGLTELFRTLVVAGGNADSQGTDLYDRLVRDMGETATNFQAWWDKASKKYNWENLENHKWEIDFETCKIYIVKQ
jgi:CXXX repeat modification system protein